MTRKRLMLVVLILAVVAAGGWFLIQRNQEGRAGLTLYGNVDIREVNLGFRVPGRVAAVLVDEGDQVKAGDVVCRLDDDPYRREVDEARAEVASLQARFDMLESGYRYEEVEQARAAVVERAATLANAQRLFDRQKELVRQRAIAQQDYDDALARLDEARARLNSARQSLALLEAGYRAEEVAQARAGLDKAKASLAAAEIRLGDTEIRAPSSGTIMTRAVEPGAIVQAGATVLTLSLNSPVWVRAYVHEPQLGQIHPGMPANVYTDSEPGKAYFGQIGFISPRAEFTPKAVETPELRTSLVYRLRIVVRDPDVGLRQGMPVTVNIDTPHRRTP